MPIPSISRVSNGFQKSYEENPSTCAALFSFSVSDPQADSVKKKLTEQKELYLEFLLGGEEFLKSYPLLTHRYLHLVGSVQRYNVFQNNSSSQNKKHQGLDRLLFKERQPTKHEIPFVDENSFCDRVMAFYDDALAPHKIKEALTLEEQYFTHVLSPVIQQVGSFSTLDSTSKVSAKIISSFKIDNLTNTEMRSLVRLFSEQFLKDPGLQLAILKQHFRKKPVKTTGNSASTTEGAAEFDFVSLSQFAYILTEMAYMILLCRNFVNEGIYHIASFYPGENLTALKWVYALLASSEKSQVFGPYLPNRPVFLESLQIRAEKVPSQEIVPSKETSLIMSSLEDVMEQVGKVVLKQLGDNILQQVKDSVLKSVETKLQEVICELLKENERQNKVQIDTLRETLHQTLYLLAAVKPTTTLPPLPSHADFSTPIVSSNSLELEKGTPRKKSRRELKLTFFTETTQTESTPMSKAQMPKSKSVSEFPSRTSVACGAK